MVWTVWQTVLCFLTDLLMRCKLQPKLHCAGCTQTRVHMLTHDTCSLSSIRGQKPWQWTPRPCHALIYLWVFICWVPQITLTLPTSPQMRPFLPKREAANIPAVSHVLLSCCCPSFFLFHRRALRFQPIRRKVRQTQQTVPTACWAKNFGPRTQLCCGSSNCLNQVREEKVRPIKTEVCHTFFQVRWTPRTRFAKQMFIQLRTGLSWSQDEAHS